MACCRLGRGWICVMDPMPPYQNLQKGIAVDTVSLNLLLDNIHNLY